MAGNGMSARPLRFTVKEKMTNRSWFGLLIFCAFAIWMLYLANHP